MDKQKKAKSRLAPLHVTFEESFKEHPEKLDYTTGILKKNHSPAIAFPPIPCDNSGLITGGSNTDFITEEKSIVKGQKTPQLPQIITFPDSDTEDETETFYNFSNHTTWLKDEENGWTTESEEDLRCVKRPEVFKKEVASLRESVKRELDKAIGIVLQARLPFLVKRVEKRKTTQKENGRRDKGVDSFCVRGNSAAESAQVAAMCCSKGEQNISSFGGKCWTQKENKSIGAVFGNNKKTSDKQKEKQKNYELNSEKNEHTPNQVIAGSESSGENFEGSFRKKGKKRNKTKRAKEKTKIVVFDDEIANSVLKKELEHFALAKKRFDLMKRREQNLLILDEQRKFEIAPRVSSPFCFSYFPPLQRKRAESEENENCSSDVCSLSLPGTISLLSPSPSSMPSAPELSEINSPRFTLLKSKGTMKDFGSHHEKTSTDDMT